MASLRPALAVQTRQLASLARFVGFVQVIGDSRALSVLFLQSIVADVDVLAKQALPFFHAYSQQRASVDSANGNSDRRAAADNADADDNDANVNRNSSSKSGNISSSSSSSNSNSNSTTTTTNNNNIGGN